MPIDPYILLSIRQWTPLLMSRFIRNNQPIAQHAISSIWLGFKPHFNEVIHNSIWIIGKGTNINFWNDYCIGSPISDILHIPPNIKRSLAKKVYNMIVN